MILLDLAGRFSTTARPSPMLFDARREPVGLWAAYTADRAVSNRNAVAERYGWLVRRVALRLHAKLPRAVELDDLIGAGNVGLIDAVEKYDATKNVRFTTYASLRIWGEMVDDLRRLDWMPKLARERKEHRPSMFSLELPVPDHDGKPVTVADVTPDPSCDDRMEWDGWLEWIGSLLPSRERFVILGYYRDGQTMQWIADRLGVTPSRASQFHREIVRRLRKRLNLDAVC